MFHSLKLLLLASLVASSAFATDLEEAALAADDACLSDGESCGLKLLQVKGEIQSHEPGHDRGMPDHYSKKPSKSHIDARDKTVEQEPGEDGELASAAPRDPDRYAEPAAKLPAKLLEDDDDESGTKKCRNHHDMMVWNGKGKIEFDRDSAFCGRRCAAGHACTASCLAEKRAYSKGCSNCMASLISCAASPKCINQCIAGQSPACNHCVRHKCRPAFKRCSGLNAGGH
eukprot:TRINITY_DN5383_c1_g1_i1.p1 TRINITY_DN5383_c1_g1~~TRINITY_DN5383_c1_g1_i1.p1  ORF type:complete len:229 (+),score=54.10 TRINITY_DN5383_c1_g1_i1:84-770(+)